MWLVQHTELYYYSRATLRRTAAKKTSSWLYTTARWNLCPFTLSHCFLEEQTRTILRYQLQMGSSGHWHRPLPTVIGDQLKSTLRLLNNYQEIKNIHVCAYMISSSLCAFHSYIVRGHTRSKQICKRADFLKNNIGSSVKDAKYLQQPLRLWNLKDNMLLSKA